MVKHVILWKLKDELTVSSKDEAIAKIKNDLEALVGNIPGLLSLHIIRADLESSNADIMLDSTLESEEALRDYQVHPMHVAAAAFVRANTELRLCADYTVE